MSKWMIPAHMLDNDQKRFMLDHVKKPENYWIKGFPGSGKSVLMMHALDDIKKREPNARILITYYTHSLKNLYEAGMQELGINTQNVSFSTYFIFRRSPANYDYIFCDEVQDLPADILIMMKSHCKRLLVAGDPHQSIYDDTIQPEQIPAVTGCSEYSLNIIHRLTNSVINLVTRILPSMDIFRSLINTQKVDVTTRLGCFEDDSDEVTYLMEQAISAVDCGQSAAILLPTHKDVLNLVECYCRQNNHPNWDKEYNQYGKPDYDRMNHHTAKLRLHYVGNGYGELTGHNAVVLMTYHSAKGLDFDNVYLPFLNQYADIRKKSLFMVALTRSKNALTLTYNGMMHAFVEEIENLCHKIEPSKSGGDNNDEWDFDF